VFLLLGASKRSASGQSHLIPTASPDDRISIDNTSPVDDSSIITFEVYHKGKKSEKLLGGFTETLVSLLGFRNSCNSLSRLLPSPLHAVYPLCSHFSQPQPPLKPRSGIFVLLPYRGGGCELDAFWYRSPSPLGFEVAADSPSALPGHDIDAVSEEIARAQQVLPSTPNPSDPLETILGYVDRLVQFGDAVAQVMLFTPLLRVKF
jgi:hypothetical protein